MYVHRDSVRETERRVTRCPNSTAPPAPSLALFRSAHARATMSLFAQFLATVALWHHGTITTSITAVCSPACVSCFVVVYKPCVLCDVTRHTTDLMRVRKHTLASTYSSTNYAPRVIALFSRERQARTTRERGI